MTLFPEAPGGAVLLDRDEVRLLNDGERNDIQTKIITQMGILPESQTGLPMQRSKRRMFMVIKKGDTN